MSWIANLDLPRLRSAGAKTKEGSNLAMDLLK